MVSRFDYVVYSPAARDAMEAIKAKAKELEALYDAIPANRERAVALTQLEDSVMWAGKAVRELK